jgi:3D (Asp-Asp-Asp) domain-containing protein
MKRLFPLIVAALVVFMTAVLTTTTDSTEAVENQQSAAEVDELAQEEDENAKIEAALLEKANKIENCTVTWYTNDTCGKTPDNLAYGITASGEPTHPHCTVATDTSLIPMYSDVCVEYADGTTEWFKATDTGVCGAHVDIYTDDYEQAVQNGVQLLTVYYIPPMEVDVN